MGNASTVFLTGAVLFFAGAVLLSLAYAYYISHGNALIEQRACTDHSRWLVTRWIYPTFIISLLLMALLYVAMYFEQGFSGKPDNLLVMWERCLVLALVAFLVSRCLTYVMTLNSDDEQSFTLVLLYTLSYVALYAATVAQTLPVRVVYISASIVFFVASIVFYFFPNNKYSDTHFHVPSRRLSYHKPFLLFIVFYFVANVVVHFASLSNEYFVNALSFDDEALAYLVVDALFMLGYPLLLVYYVFANLSDTIRYTRKKDGKVSFGAKNRSTLVDLSGEINK